NSIEFCTQLVKQTGVAASPGAGFGKSGEGYVRFALVHEPPLLETAVERIAQFLQRITYHADCKRQRKNGEKIGQRH
ncbi:hypothetical protein QHH11_29165, partial [Aphanizomenon sp. PH219]|nr:hypothetical protein [Aphanizomenon sp. PH219]